jgi:hypothetical protein
LSFNDYLFWFDRIMDITGMERNDSTAAMASLASYAEESESDEEGKVS